MGRGADFKQGITPSHTSSPVNEELGQAGLARFCPSPCADPPTPVLQRGPGHPAAARLVRPRLALQVPARRDGAGGEGAAPRQPQHLPGGSAEIASLPLSP